MLFFSLQMPAQARPFQQPYLSPAPTFVSRPMAPPQNGQTLQIPMSTPMSIQQPISQSSSPVMAPQAILKGSPSPLNGDSSPMTDGSSIPATTAPVATGNSSPVLSPTNGIKKPKLRLQIPTEAKESNATNTTLADAMIKTEDSSELPPVSLFLSNWFQMMCTPLSHLTLCPC